MSAGLAAVLASCLASGIREGPVGATGHVGSAVAENLLRFSVPVTVVTRDERKAASWCSRGAQAAVVDIADVDALRRVFALGRRVFLLNPPASPAMDIEREERRTLASIFQALTGSAWRESLWNRPMACGLVIASAI